MSDTAILAAMGVPIVLLGITLGIAIQEGVHIAVHALHERIARWFR